MSFRVLALAALAPRALGANLVASHFSGTLFSLSFDNNTDTLSVTSEATGCGRMPAWLDFRSDTRHLYCFDESWFGSGILAEFSVDSYGKLSLTGQARTAGQSVHGTLYGGPDGRAFVATAEYSPSTITTYKLPVSGARVQQQEKFISSRGPHPRQDAPHPHEVHVDPSGKFVLVPDLGADLIRIFKAEPDGRLSLCSEAKADPGDGPRHVKFWESASGKRKLFSLNELSNTVSAWDIDGISCLRLTKTQTLSTYPPGKQGGPLTKAAELHAVGNFLYASNRADESFGPEQDSIAVYRIDLETGELEFVELANSYSFYPRTFQVNADGTLVAVGGQTSSNVAIIARDPETGKLGDLLASVQVGQRGRPNNEDGLSAVVWVD